MAEFDPDQYRMSLGEHLEELRLRMIYGLIGFGLVLTVCLVLARSYVVPLFCAPLLNTLSQYNLNPQLVTSEVGEGFMVFVRISVISAGALAAPWMLYQLWQFVAAGLYPHERRIVTRYVPLSIGLLLAGMALVYLVVLPMTLRFFVAFSIGIPIQGGSTVTATTAPVQPQVPVLAGDPAEPRPEGLLWFDSVQRRLKLEIGGQVRVISFGSDELLRPEISLDEYISLVVSMLVAFALAFQLPLVVLALVRIGILDREQLLRSRRYVYFVMVIAAAVITPGSDIPSLIGLTIPLCLLFELGIWLARPQAGRGFDVSAR
jgi:sec-independent protein translocase protein TatC